MGTSLSGLTPSTTYPALLKTSDNTVINSTLKTISDGSGDDTVLQLSTLRIGIKSDSTVTTQTSSVIQSSTTNASLVIAPNGTGALMAQIPDGAVAGGNARGGWAVDLQLVRGFGSEVASGAYSFAAGFGNTASGAGSIAMGQRNLASQLGSTAIGGGGGAGGGVNATAQFATAVGGYQNNASGTYSGVFSGTANTVSSNYGVVTGGQGNTASTNTHATVVGGQGNTASGQYSVAGGQSGIASGLQSMAFNGTASGQSSVSLGGGNQAIARFSTALGYNSKAYLYNQLSVGSVGSSFGFVAGSSQLSFLVALTQGALLTGGTTVLTLDGDGGNLIIPTGTNRAWNVTSSWVAVVTTITGTATGITVGDVVTSVDLLGFKKVGGVSSASTHTSAATKLMVTTPANYAACAIAYTAGAVNQEMALTFTGPTFLGGGSVTMRVVARIELTEVAF